MDNENGPEPVGNQEAIAVIPQLGNDATEKVDART